MADLNKVRAEVFSLYQQQRYEEALRVANEVADDFPASSTYWTACLLAVQDRQEQALDALMDALNKGAWWPSLMLQRDPDLDSIRQSPEFARIRTESERRWKLAFKAEPEILVHTPRTSPSGVLLIALHGSPGEPAETFARHWRTALEQGAVVVVPQSSQPHGPEGGWTWADEERTDKDLRLVYETVSKRPGFDPDKVVLAGFSQGARVAISTALRQDPIRACGFIAVGPAFLDHPIEQDLRAAPALRGHITVGDQDWVLESVKEFHATAAGQGQQWSLHLVPNVAHDFPPDFDDRLGKALTLVADAP